MKSVLTRAGFVVFALLLCMPGTGCASSENLCENVTARVSSIYQNDMAGHSPKLLFDGRHDLGWGTAESETTGWVEFDLEKAAKVCRVVLDEGLLNRIRGYVFKAKLPDGSWKELVRGERLGYMVELEFLAVTARTFRLEVTKATATPALWEIELYSTPAPKFGNPREMAPKDSLKKFHDLKLGAFVIWGPHSLAGGEYSFCRGGHVPKEKYDNLYKEFDPKNFDSDQWIRILKEAGFRYIVFVPKHHDGFCLWDTKTTDYNIMNSPFGKDVVKALVESCKKYGMDFNLYYSIGDFYNPDYLPNGYLPFGSDFGGPGYQLSEGQEPDFERYVTYMKTHLKELSDIAGPCTMWWFDANWSPNWTPRHGRDMYAYMRKLQPKGLFGNRIGCAHNARTYVPTWFASEKRSFGDYVGLELAMYRFRRDIPWEYTIPALATYGWTKTPVKPGLTFVDTAVKAACGDGNFLLGTASQPDGKFDERTAEQLKVLGDWTTRFGESYYGTRGGPYKRTIWYGSTCRDNTMYLHIFKTDDDGKLVLPPLGRKILNSAMLGSDAKVDVQQDDSSVTVRIDKDTFKPLYTIVKMELDGDAVSIEPVGEPALTTGVVAKASSTADDSHSASNTCDGDIATCWKAKPGETTGWIEYDLGKEHTVSRAILHEGAEDGQYDNIWTYQIEAKLDGEWKPVFASKAAYHWQVTAVCPEPTFQPVKARYFRLNVTAAADDIIVHEFKLYER